MRFCKVLKLMVLITFTHSKGFERRYVRISNNLDVGTSARVQAECESVRRSVQARVCLMAWW